MNKRYEKNALFTRILQQERFNSFKNKNREKVFPHTEDVFKKTFVLVKIKTRNHIFFNLPTFNYFQPETRHLIYKQ